MENYAKTIEDMTVKELINYAKDNDIDLGKNRKKDVILDIIRTAIGESGEINKNVKFEEETKMEENTMNQEMVVTEGTEAIAEAPAKSERVFTDNDGNECTMSQFIREKFVKDNMSRKDISEQFDINYRTVYGATVNMTNDAAPATRGRSAQNIQIDVTEDGHVVTSKEVEGVTVYFIDGEEIKANENDEIVVPATTNVNRNSWIKDQVAAGVDRATVAKALEISYGVVYGLTKEEGHGRTQHTVTVDGKEVPRTEYIRTQVAAGVKKSDVAKELGVEYSVVWQACKTEKTDAEKFETVLETIAKFTDKVEDAEAFAIILDELKAVVIKEEVDESADANETTEATETTAE